VAIRPERQLNVERLRRNTYVLGNQAVLYVAVAKAACTSLKHIVAQIAGEPPFEGRGLESAEIERELIVHERGLWRTPSLADIGETAKQEVLQSRKYFRFTVVRNPFTRLFSAWQSKLLLREPLQVGPYEGHSFYQIEVRDSRDVAAGFEGFLEHVASQDWPTANDHWARQTELAFLSDLHYTHIGKVETLSETLTALGAHLQAPISPAKVMNRSLIPWDDRLLTSRAVDLIRTLYDDDFRSFGYATTPPPAHRQLSDSEWKVALDAVHMLRARHQRFADIYNRLAALRSSVARNASTPG
jgi:hypothetical protein